MLPLGRTAHGTRPGRNRPQRRSALQPLGDATDTLVMSTAKLRPRTPLRIVTALHWLHSALLAFSGVAALSVESQYGEVLLWLSLIGSAFVVAQCCLGLVTLFTTTSLDAIDEAVMAGSTTKRHA